MLFTAFAYIKFLLKSKNQHAVHSPFVFGFITKCLYDKTNHGAYQELRKYRNKLLGSKAVINVEDFGSGSKKLQNERSVKQMVKISGSTNKKTKILYGIANYFNLQNTLELGTHLGLGTQALALRTPNKVTTVEGCANTFGFTTSQLQLENISFINSKFSDYLQHQPKKKFDCIFFDGHHDKQGTIKYFTALKNHAHNDSIFIFDDIYWSKGMTDAWDSIINDPDVTVSLDCFHFGFVFFRKEQPKQHFIIRL